MPSIPLWSQSPFVGFDGAGDEKLLGIIHETIEEDKGPKLALKCLISLPLIDVEDVKVNPLHVFFDLKGGLLGRIILKLITSCLHRLT